MQKKKRRPSTIKTLTQIGTREKNFRTIRICACLKEITSRAERISSSNSLGSKTQRKSQCDINEIRSMGR